MKKLLLLIIFYITMIGICYAQNEKPTTDDDFILVDKKTHESIRKDLENYKVLLLQHKLLKQEFDFFKKEHDELSFKVNQATTELGQYEIRYNLLSFKYDKVIVQNNILMVKVKQLEFDKELFNEKINAEKKRRYQAEKFAKYSTEYKIGVVGLSVFCIILMAQQGR